MRSVILKFNQKRPLTTFLSIEPKVNGIQLPEEKYRKYAVSAAILKPA